MLVIARPAWAVAIQGATTKLRDAALDCFAALAMTVAREFCSVGPGITVQPEASPRTAINSTSTLNSGRVKPDTTSRVDA